MRQQLSINVCVCARAGARAKQSKKCFQAKLVFFPATVQRETTLNRRWWRTQLLQNKYIYLHFASLKCECWKEDKLYLWMPTLSSSFALKFKRRRRLKDPKHTQPSYCSNGWSEKTTCTSRRTISGFISTLPGIPEKSICSRSTNYFNMSKSKKSGCSQLWWRLLLFRSRPFYFQVTQTNSLLESPWKDAAVEGPTHTHLHRSQMERSRLHCFSHLRWRGWGGTGSRTLRCPVEVGGRGSVNGRIRHLPLILHIN